ncbi:MAG TPA: alanine--tRNA ligase-related protein, partial [Candidatus Woesebacteria bacterium]|nr:alanine--tRNA ligase-related protein [Candidatus Woesebacteria bacterium]
MNARELKNKFIEFFVSQGHVEIPSASLVPENDPTTLFISAGMHPLVPYLLGTPHPLGKRLVDVQKCVRTGDIEEVGDTYHHTFFEMLGNWSLGDYFKEDAIKFSYQFLTSVLGFDPKRLSVTVFAGDQNAPKDEESSKIWQSLGITNISYLPKENNWWGPAGTTGPCGPDTEMFLDGVEVWNDVFMQYNKTADGKFELLPKPNVDTGMGVERTVAFLNRFNDDYLSSIWQPIIKKIEELSGKKYGLPCQGEVSRYDRDGGVCTKSMRIIADHIRTTVFMIADGVEPSNKEAGYVLRRVIRRSIRQAKLLG